MAAITSVAKWHLAVDAEEPSTHLRCRSDSPLSNVDSSNRETLITFIHAAVTQPVRTARLR